MKTIPEQIAELEKKIRQTPYHKGTEHQVGRWRARVAKLRHQMWGRQTKKVGGGQGFAIKKAGDATVVLVGPPSVGKSSLLNCLTDARSRVGSFDFTTLIVIPGMMKYQGAQIQIFDVPGIIEGASAGKGRGREVLGVMRAADLLLIMVDPAKRDWISKIKKELDEFGIRLDQAPHLVVINKIDLVKKEKIPQIFGTSFLFISVKKNQGIEELKGAIWQKLNLIRIYLKPKDKEPNLQEPLIVKRGMNLKEILSKIAIPNKEEIKKAKICGPGAKFAGQMVSLDFQPQEGTIISFFN